jgi:hypothetical protein
MIPSLFATMETLGQDDYVKSSLSVGPPHQCNREVA